jgi:alpha 1,2-mannosyltransferase
MLARESDLPGVLSSMRSLEERFNTQWQYPWVLLNEVAFSDEFKACAHSRALLSDLTDRVVRRNVTSAINGTVSFGVIPHEHWFQPEWIDEERAREGRERLKDQPYGGAHTVAIITARRLRAVSDSVS